MFCDVKLNLRCIDFEIQFIKLLLDKFVLIFLSHVLNCYVLLVTLCYAIKMFLLILNSISDVLILRSSFFILLFNKFMLIFLSQIKLSSIYFLFGTRNQQYVLYVFLLETQIICI